MYSVKGVYHILIQEEHHVCTSFMKLIWNKATPLKVSLFAWRIMNERISTKDNLVRRKVFCYDSLACPSGCGKEKIINHLFLMWLLRKNLNFDVAVAWIFVCPLNYCLHACYAVWWTSYVQEGYLSFFSNDLIDFHLDHL